jgi:hypothetical protein
MIGEDLRRRREDVSSLHLAAHERGEGNRARLVEWSKPLKLTP